MGVYILVVIYGDIVWDLKDLVYNLIVFLYIVIFKEIEYFFLELKKKIFREYDVWREIKCVYLF